MTSPAHYLTKDEIQSAIEERLRELWEDIALGGEGHDVSSILWIAGTFLSPDLIELWELRLKHKCPGHNGGQVWCHYCGDIPYDAEVVDER